MTLTIKNRLTKTALFPAVVAIIILVPFANKAFHMDDTLFIAAAKHIQSDPTNFYGFNINWYGLKMPMAEVAKNPPLACYYIALVAGLLGWNEIVLHIAFVVPAVAAALGSFYLAKQFCSQPVLAALASVLTPVFLVSSTNVMCDTMMLAFWVWAVVFWLWGADKNQWSFLLISAALIAISALTKYFGMSLILLLFVYSLAKKRKIGTWALYLLAPVAILALYQWATFALYGRGLLTDAASYATKRSWNPGGEFLWKGLICFTFMGGGMITVLFYAPLIWSRRILVSSVVLMVLFLFSLGLLGRIGNFPVRYGSVVRWDILIQFGLMLLAGVGIIWLTVADLYNYRDCKSLLLFLWVLGTFFFAGFVNWTVNERSILPVAPVVGILLVRVFDRQGETSRQIKGWRVKWPLILTAIVALSVCWADYTLAGTARDAAKTIHKAYRNRPNVVWFQGHWGFQYYMEFYDGGRALDFKNSRPLIGDIIVIPINNTNLEPLPKDRAFLVQAFEFVPCRWLSTINTPLGAGFYSSRWGPLPFALGLVPVEKHCVFVVK
jgi:4-amino-4-deoxy-L-arabinose transferase-like glycosyltransferase